MSRVGSRTKPAGEGSLTSRLDVFSKPVDVRTLAAQTVTLVAG